MAAIDNGLTVCFIFPAYASRQDFKKLLRSAKSDGWQGFLIHKRKVFPWDEGDSIEQLSILNHYISF